ncbi:DUF3829 domain-containing protein [Isobaculum melis]|uniref:DUF3829 domain-containing protein n=1 Tax=Isobaculum melis TaxID=142588 RepID=A0A1H9PPP6_9LACT|nr:DUF3829 domain-containing protein [Isobaculum melis]SER50050.1 Protein of unknown function [Isobaculum melis]
MKKMKKLFAILAVLTLTFVATGCSLIDGVKDGISGGSSSKETKEIDKYNDYVNLLNILTGKLTSYESNYAKNHMDEEANFMNFDESNWSEYSMHHDLDALQEVVKAADEATSAKPKMDIDGKAEKLVAALKDELDIFEDIHTYYKEKDFLTDDYAKGKELHEKLMVAYKALDEPAQAFYDEMQELMEEHEKEEREGYEKDGHKVSLAMLDFIDTAEEATNLVYDNVAEDGSITLTAEQYTEVNTKVSNALDALKEISEDKDALEKDGYSIGITAFVNSATSFKTASNTVTGSFGDPDTLQTALEKLLREYSTLINSYNNTVSN